MVFIVFVQKEFDGNALVQRGRVQAIGPGKVKNMGLYAPRQFTDALLFFNGNARIVTDLLFQARQLVENGGLPGVGVTYEGHIDLLTHSARVSSTMSSSMSNAVSRRMAIWHPLTLI